MCMPKQVNMYVPLREREGRGERVEGERERETKVTHHTNNRKMT